MTLARLREWVRDLQARYGASERQVCFALQVSRSSFRYRSVAADDSALRLRIREITETPIHYGYRRVHVMLRREGWRDNHKRIYRLYSEQGLSLRLKRPRRNKSAQRRQPQPQGLYPNHVWGMDFVSDALFDGRRLRLLTVIDLYTRECLGICVGQNLRSTEVAEMLNTIALRRPLPELLKTDNGSEFAGKMLDKWVYERGIRIDFSRPGTPTDNATVESFNGRMRQGCLNENWFMCLENARCKIEAWRIHYNQKCPHSALGWMTLSEFAEKSTGCQNMQPT
ncbi:TPA: IS3 family transposase [Enterobacter kobei]|nr:IS3 family transposase [Enterobacter kobei]HEP0985666.1 IS3 family transposase [Enterobacter ludwigii]